MFETRVSRVFSLFAGALVLLGVQAFALQVVNRDEIIKEHEARIHGRFVRAPRRGEILYADGTPIASNEPGFSVAVNVDAFFAPRWRCGSCGAVVTRLKRPDACSDPTCGAKDSPAPVPAPDADALARMLGISKEEFGDQLAKVDKQHQLHPTFRYHELVKDVDRDTAVAVSLAASQFPGVVVRARPARVVDSVAADIAGRARDPDDRDVDELTDKTRAGHVYSLLEVYSMRFGKTGLELAFDARLRGDPGTARHVGKSREPLEERPVVDGSPLVTTLRRDVQTVAEEVVHDGDVDAAAVVLDLSDGGVVALASRAKDGLEHAVCGLRPGSVFKLATALALLESGVSPEETVHCAGSGRLASGRPYVCDDVHGDIAFTDAFAQSCNTYFATMAERVGPEAMIRACGELGLSVNPRLHLNGSPCGLEMKWGDGPRWWPADMSKIGIGQGKALVSPLQVALAYGRIATGGRRLTPYLVDEDRPPAADVDPSIARFAPLLRDAARRVVTVGTGKSIPELGAIEACGKTGTCNLTSGESLHNAWFVAFAPASNPRFVAVVVYEGVKEHGATRSARPVARLLAEALK
jgi:cell division protein FtsI/penicillin-binding protein 2